MAPTPATTSNNNNNNTSSSSNNTATTTTSSTAANTTPKNQPPMNFTTSDIGASFVASYYGTLTQKPQKLILLYKPTSQVTHSIHDGETDVQHFTGLDQISPALSDFTNELAKNVKVKLHSVECQGALENSVLILVNGALQKTNTSTPESVQFTQSFLLAPQKNGYYVANDILRLEVPKSQSFNNHIRDSIDVDSTAATQGEGSVVSAGQLDQEDVLSSDSALNGDSVSEPKSIESEKEEEEKQKKVKKVKKEKKTKAQKPAQTEQPAAATTTASTTQEQPASTQPATEKAEKKKKTRKQKTEEKQQAVKKEETPVAAPRSDVPTTYASIVGGDEYSAPQPKVEKKKFIKTKKFEKTDKPEKSEKSEKKEGSGSKSEEQPKKKFYEKRAAPEKEKTSKPVEKVENGTPATPTTDGEQPFEKKKSRFDRSKAKKEFTTKIGTEGKPLRRKFVESEEKYGIYVSKVDPNTTSQQLQETFSKYGEIVDMNNRAKNNEKKPKFKLGYALIFFKTQEAMKKALEDKEISIGDNKVAISEHSKREKPEKFQEKAVTPKQPTP